METIRIGCGAGYADDILEPAIELIEQGNLDYICFECLAERTIAIAQKQKMSDPTKGYNSRLEERMKQVLPLAQKNKVKIITNMGVANVEQAVKITADIAISLGISGMKIAGVMGDDIFHDITKYNDYTIVETGEKLSELGDTIVSANVYLGASGIVDALKNGADVVITGRCSDPALFLAPAIYEFGWKTDDLLGMGTSLGHLMECGGYVTGGYFDAPGLSHVEDVWNFGYPIAEVKEDGTFYLTKLPKTGGRLDRHTCTEQLLYEIHDPASYLTPDVIADFSNISFEEISSDVVRVTGATGKPATEFYKVSIGYRDSIVGTTEIGHGGYGAIERCETMIEGAKKLWNKLGIEPLEYKFGIIGYNSILTGPEIPLTPKELMTEGRIRCAVRTNTKEEAQRLMDCVTTGLGLHTAGASVMVHNIKEVIAIKSILVPKNDIKVTLIYREV